MAPVFGIGKVKWFGDERNGGQYGFITSADGHDHFFHGHEAFGFDPKEGQLVVYELQPSHRHPGRNDAHYVHLVDRWDHAGEILRASISLFASDANETYCKSLAKRFGEVIQAKGLNAGAILNEIHRAGLIAKTPEGDYIQPNFSCTVSFLLAALPAEMNHECLNLLFADTPKDIIRAQYLEGSLPFGRYVVDVLLEGWASLSKEKQSQIILASKSDAYFLLERYVALFKKAFAETGNPNILLQLESIISEYGLTRETICLQPLPESVQALLVLAPLEQRWGLYWNGYIPLSQDLAMGVVLTWDNLTPENKQAAAKDSIQNNIPLASELTNRILIPLSHQHSYQAINILAELDVLFPGERAQIVSMLITSGGNDVFRALLWLRGYTDEISTSMLPNAVSVMTTEDQRLLLKRLFHFMRSNDSFISLAQLLHFVWTDISIWVALEILDAIKSGIMPSQEAGISSAIYGYIIKHITDPAADLVIDDFLDVCHGRSYINRTGNMEIDDPPWHVTWCEGRPALKDGQPSLDKKHQRIFWWCGNQMCFQSSIPDSIRDNYTQYTLFDFFSILGIKFGSYEYGKLLGSLNRVRQLTKRIKCRDCGHIMHPAGKAKQSLYAFYRVNRFKCANPECNNRDTVYLSHCLNKYCNNIVDSRDSAKCSPHNHVQQECGWYVCNYCLACCSTDKLRERAANLARFGIEYTCHLEGHKDRGEICCPKCGRLLTIPSSGDIRDWITQHKANRHFVVNSGTRQKDGKEWFRLRKSAFGDNDAFFRFMQSAARCGFGTPDIEDPTKEIYLLGEPYDDDSATCLVCSNCSFELDIGDIQNRHDYQRLSALRYHDYINKVAPRPVHAQQEQ